MTTINYMLSLLVHNLSRNIFLWVKFSNYTYMWLPLVLMKNTLTIIRSELKNSMCKIKQKTRMPFLYPQQSEQFQNIQNFQWKIHFSFPQIAQKGTQYFCFFVWNITHTKYSNSNHISSSVDIKDGLRFNYGPSTDFYV